MGPRSAERGRPGLSPITAAHRSLQWGSQLAEPRKGSTAQTRSNPYPRFTGAAPAGAAEGEIRRLADQEAYQLQWGRALSQLAPRKGKTGKLVYLNGIASMGSLRSAGAAEGIYLTRHKISVGSFNGAALCWSVRKGEHLRLNVGRRMWASMGPRSDERGRGTRCRTSTRSLKLQWGRALMSRGRTRTCEKLE